MNKLFVDEMIANMKKAGIVTKATPWMVEGMGEREMNVRYVGFRPFDDWLALFSSYNNLLLKFIVSRSESSIDFFLANKPPFVFITKKHFTTNDKWETLLGEVKRRLSKDKEDATHHQGKVGNIYIALLPYLK